MQDHDMDITLALKLQAAGFPYWDEGEEIKALPDGTTGNAPTLEQVIETIGDKFMCLLKHDDGSGWTAMKTGDNLMLLKHSEGKTPIEATANCWLSLQSKV